MMKSYSSYIYMETHINYVYSKKMKQNNTEINIIYPINTWNKNWLTKKTWDFIEDMT